MTDDADRQVRELLKEVYAAWEANDADAFAEPYAEPATATLPGMYLSGRQAIHDAMAALDLTAEPRGLDYLETEVGGLPAMWVGQALRTIPQ